jgi:hypothetical protein
VRYWKIAKESKMNLLVTGGNEMQVGDHEPSVPPHWATRWSACKTARERIGELNLYR